MTKQELDEIRERATNAADREPYTYTELDRIWAEDDREDLIAELDRLTEGLAEREGSEEAQAGVGAMDPPRDRAVRQVDRIEQLLNQIVNMQLVGRLDRMERMLIRLEEMVETIRHRPERTQIAGGYNARPWIPASERPPPSIRLCDFIYPATQEDDGVWMLCSCKVGETNHYTGDWTHWRLADPLPVGVCVCQVCIPVPMAGDKMIAEAEERVRLRRANGTR